MLKANITQEDIHVNESDWKVGRNWVARKKIAFFGKKGRHLAQKMLKSIPILRDTNKSTNRNYLESHFFASYSFLFYNINGNHTLNLVLSGAEAASSSLTTRLNALARRLQSMCHSVFSGCRRILPKQNAPRRNV